ncbi:MAG TPA: ABC transporter permease, partial [Longimicrobiales bacterium]|nr:ABC transporter permease [Longimicrobiales bacterium]
MRPRPPNRLAILVCTAGAVLAGVAVALFRWTNRLEPILQEDGAADPMWLTRFTSAFRAPAWLQRAALADFGQVVFAIALCAILIAAVGFLAFELSRFSRRRLEFAVRSAVGATPLQVLARVARPIARQAAASAAIAAPVTVLLIWLCLQVWPGTINTSVPPRLWLGVIGALAFIALSSLVLLIAVRALVLRGVSWLVLRGGTHVTSSLGETRLRELLTIAQIAASVVLITVTAILARSDATRFVQLEGESAELQVIRASAGASAQLPVAVRAARLDAVLQRARELPGVRAESLASAGAVLGLGVVDRVYSECDICRFGPVVVPFALRTPRAHAVGPRFFELTRTRVLAGREFNARDRAGAQPVAIVNQAFAHSVFGPGNPIGRIVRLHNGWSAAHVIVGMVDDLSSSALGAAPGSPALYVSALQYPPVNFDVLLLANGDIRSALAGIEPVRAVPLW